MNLNLSLIILFVTLKGNYSLKLFYFKQPIFLPDQFSIPQYSSLHMLTVYWLKSLYSWEPLSSALSWNWLFRWQENILSNNCHKWSKYFIFKLKRHMSTSIIGWNIYILPLQSSEPTENYELLEAKFVFKKKLCIFLLQVRISNKRLKKTLRKEVLLVIGGEVKDIVLTQTLSACERTYRIAGGSFRPSQFCGFLSLIPQNLTDRPSLSVSSLESRLSCWGQLISALGLQLRGLAMGEDIKSRFWCS